MVNLKGPALAQDASGKLAEALTYSKSGKTAYLKKHAAPANPRTPPQLSVRAAMSFLATQWKTISPANQATWLPPAGRQHIAAYHAYIAYNQNRWNNWRSPSKTYPAPEAGAPMHKGDGAALDGVASINIRIYQRAPKPTWGYCLYRTPVPVGSATHDQLVAIIPIDPVYTLWYLDTPLEPGTYHYRHQPFHDDGTFGLLRGPYSGTAT